MHVTTLLFKKENKGSILFLLKYCAEEQEFLVSNIEYTFDFGIFQLLLAKKPVENQSS